MALQIALGHHAARQRRRAKARIIGKVTITFQRALLGCTGFQVAWGLSATADAEARVKMPTVLK